MRTRVMAIMAGLLLAAGSAANADNEWGVYGAWWSPSDGDDAFGGGVKVAFEVVDRVQLDLRYTLFSDVIDDRASGLSLDTDALEGGLSFAIPMSDDIEASLGAGIGQYFMDGRTGAGESIDDETGFYLSAGVEWTLHRSGADYGETSAKLFAEAVYRFVDIDAGGSDADLDGFGLQAGLLVGW